ncbi:MAG: biopolymer transporter ExbD [Verrucomicrobia bacterium]|nr:MAG: biopolymer transporter ExbD [Verrucomicrobiota bacterium]
MKFHRNARILRSQFDVTPYASVFFLLVLFVMLGTLVYTPGVRVPLQLPVADGLPGTDQPSVNVAVAADGKLFFQNQPIEAAELKTRLAALVTEAGKPLTLVVQADKAVTHDMLIRLTLLAREAGIHDALLATLPRLVDTAPNSPAP